MSAGLPVVASSVGGLKEVVIDRTTGLLVPPGNVDALTRALAMLAASREFRHELGAAGHARSEAMFRPETTAVKIFDIYDELAGRRRTHGMRPRTGR
jgi:glycosyltransferase involved in cell wall biosynthesis